MTMLLTRMSSTAPPRPRRDLMRIPRSVPMKVQLLCLEAINYIREQSRTNVTFKDIERVGEAIKGQDVWL